MIGGSLTYWQCLQESDGLMVTVDGEGCRLWKSDYAGLAVGAGVVRDAGSNLGNNGWAVASDLNNALQHQLPILQYSRSLASDLD